MSLHKHMGESTFVESYRVADSCWELTTNSEELLAAAKDSFPEGKVAPESQPDLRLHLLVSDAKGSGTWERPICRGRDQFAFCCIGDESALAFDVRRRIATGSVTRSVAAEARYWREVVFPFVLGVMAPVLHAVPLHAACFRYRGDGVLIGARSGAGKSTLAATLARRGTEFISDDWVYLTNHRGLRAHALPVPLKLLPDATTFFPEIRSLAATPAQNGELSIAFDPAEVFGGPRGFRCEPRVVILFDRVPGATLRVGEASERDLLEWFSEPLDCVPPCLEAQRQEQTALILALRECRCYVVTCDGTPEELADMVLRVCDGTVAIREAGPYRHSPKIEHLDLLRRGVPANCTAAIGIGTTTVAMSTNDPAVVEQFAASDNPLPEFKLTVITEADWRGSGESHAHKFNSLGYRSLGADGLIAFDMDAREAAAFVSRTAVRSGRLRHELQRMCNTHADVAAAVAP